MTNKEFEKTTRLSLEKSPASTFIKITTMESLASSYKITLCKKMVHVKCVVNNVRMDEPIIAKKLVQSNYQRLEKE